MAKVLNASVVLLVQLILAHLLFCDAAPDLKMNELSNLLEDELDLLVRQATGKEMLEQKYSEQVFYLEPVHGEDILEEAIEKLEPMFQRRIRAVEEIARKAEELAMTHEYQEQPQSSQAHFINGKDWDDPNFFVNTSFMVNQHQSGHSTLVNINSSAVHLPLQTYEGWMWHRFKPVWYEDFDTINSLIWSNQLDPVFAENLKRDPTIHWQYFASKEGLLRYFPAHRWRTHTNEQDTYDARQRPWFTQTIASPKDLLILIDMSGSIHGPTFEMVKITVKRLLGTLSQDDYFNVLQFNETVSWLLPCSDMLIPATTRNKRLIYQALDHVEPQGRASYANVLNFTYHLILELENLRTNDSGPRSSNCHLAVVLISDGGTEFPAEQMEMITNNSITRQTRLFTLAVGPHPIPTLNLRNISCSTNAFHGAILTYGAIRSKVQGYLQVLSRPLALSLDESLIQWSLPYEDAAGSSSVLTVSKPVFQKGENLSQTLLGVAGVDIPLVSFDRALPDSILGYGGYKMVVMPTGNVVIHPKLAEHSSFLEDQLMVDFEDLESNGNWTDELRLQLVNGEIGSLQYSPTVMTSDNSYVVRPKRSWHFRPIAKTSYTIAVSIIEDINMVVPNLELQGDIKWNYNILTRTAPRKYCYNVNAGFSGYNEMPTYFHQLSEAFEKRGGDCDYTALSHLLWDFETTANVSQMWALTPHVHSRFVITTGGVTRMELGTPEFLQQDLIDPHNSSIFLRLAHSANTSLLIQPPSSRNQDYTVAAKIDLKDQLLAVTGALLSPEKILSVWDKILKTYNAEDHDSLYWLDEGGYIIASNTKSKVGTFIGHADAQLADQLLSGPNPVFSKETVLVSTTSCPMFAKSSPTSSAPAFIARWASNAIQTLFGVANIIATFIVATLSPVLGNFQAEMELEKLRPAKVDSHICSKDYVLFHLKASADSVLELPCNSLCSGNNETIRAITVHPMKKSKTVMISATSPCNCANIEIKHGLVKVENEILKCQFNKRFRKPAEMCYASDPRENSLECSAPSVRQVILPSMLLVFAVLWIIH